MDVLRYSVTLRTFRLGHASKDQQVSDSRDKPRASRRGAAKQANDKEE
jgi:hypothetical protein